ncbi:MAG: NAD-binding protein [Acidimicrobiia bacterium]|nr:NAD-binding protein [Acidimicrobiia bacterium]
MHVVIAGAGRVGAALAHKFAADGSDVVVIDHDQEALDLLGRGFNGGRELGEAFDVPTLTRAGTESADVFLAVTSNDNANLVAVEIVKAVFGVPRSIARLSDPAREGAYNALGIEFVAGTTLIANLVYQDIVDVEFQHHLSFEGGSDVEMVEFVINREAAGRTVGRFEVRDRLRIAAVRRGSEVHIPGSRFVLEEGDLVVAAAREGVRRRIDIFVKDQP